MENRPCDVEVEAEARWAAVALVQVRGGAALDGDARSGDGEHRTDLGYVSAVKWAGQDAK